MLRRLLKRVRRRTKRKLPSREYLKYKEMARAVIHARLEYFAPICGVTYSRVAIRNQRKRWGSCSSLGNLNFSYRVAFLPDELRDYVIVHELCHLKELNHRPAFWALVAAVLPDYENSILAIRAIEKAGSLLPPASLNS